MAEDIIKNYQEIKVKLQESRSAFLDEKNKKIVKKINEKEEKFNKMLEYRQGVEERKRIKEKLMTALHKIEKKSQSPRERTPEMKRFKIDLKHFTQKLLKPIQAKVEARRLKENEDFLMTFVKSKTRPRIVDFEESRRNFHPPSKILIKPSSSNHKDFMGLETFSIAQKTARKRNESIEEYKLSLHGHPSDRNSVKFRKFYSGGPVDDEHQMFNVFFFYFVN